MDVQLGEPRTGVEPDLESWLAPHWALLHRVAVSLCGPADGEDVLQDALVAAWRKRAQFDPRRGPERAWLLAIVTDQARKLYARRRRSRAVPFALTPDVAAPIADAAGKHDLRVAVRLLSARQREAVVLHYFADLSVAEVADAMRCSVGTVKSTLSDARARLKQLLGEQ